MRHLLVSSVLGLSLLFGCSSSRKDDGILKAKSALVRITGMLKLRPTYCTGMVVKQNVVLTAAHCLDDEMKVDDQPVEKLIKKDPYYDLALLSAMTHKSIIRFRDDPTFEGEGLTALGYGYGWEQPLILAQRVVLPNYPIEEDSPAGIIVQGGYIGGMSGGPLVDSNGQVVGIVQRSRNSTGYGVGTQMIKAFLLDAGISLED